MTTPVDITLAVSGSSGKLTKRQKRLAIEVIRGLFDADQPLRVTRINTGAAAGIDTLAFYAAYAFAGPDVVHAVKVPEGKVHNARLVDTARVNGAEVELVPGGYMARNDALVADAHLLVAFPPSRFEARRGDGTWATVRRARSRDLPVYLFPLDGSEPTREEPGPNAPIPGGPA